MSTQKIALFGATGMIGSEILTEARRRNYTVTAITRNPQKVAAQEGVTAVAGNVLDADSVAEVVAGHDIVVSAYGPGADSAEKITEAAHALLAGVKQAGVKRLIVVGGAGSLEVAPGVTLVSVPDFPEIYRAVALAHQDALDIFRANDSVEWSYLSPPAIIQPGERTSKFRLGKDNLLSDADGNSQISTADFAIALVDEIEAAAHTQERFTVAY